VKRKQNNAPLDERQTQERHRFGFHSFIIACVELCIVLISSMFWYDWINTQISFYCVMVFCLIIPILYFNIRTKISGVTNTLECLFSIFLALLYVISLIISLFTGSFTVLNLVFGILFIINGFIGFVYLIEDKKAELDDYNETHGKDRENKN
jgi:hypothetical protein